MNSHQRRKQRRKVARTSRASLIKIEAIPYYSMARLQAALVNNIYIDEAHHLTYGDIDEMVGHSLKNSYKFDFNLVK